MIVVVANIRQLGFWSRF